MKENDLSTASGDNGLADPSQQPAVCVIRKGLYPQIRLFDHPLRWHGSTLFHLDGQWLDTPAGIASDIVRH